MNEKGCFEGIYSKKDFLKLVYFDIQVLERYFEDPKYLIFYSDYRGSIVIDDKYVDEDADRIEYLKDFGLAHKKDNFYERANFCRRFNEIAKQNAKPFLLILSEKSR